MLGLLEWAIMLSSFYRLNMNINKQRFVPGGKKKGKEVILVTAK